MGSVLFSPLLLLCRIVGEQIQLFRLLTLPGCDFVHQMVGADAQPPDQQSRVHDPVIERTHRLHQIMGRGGILSQIGSAMGMLGNLASVVVGGHRAGIVLPAAPGR